MAMRQNLRNLRDSGNEAGEIAPKKNIPAALFSLQNTPFLPLAFTMLFFLLFLLFSAAGEFFSFYELFWRFPLYFSLQNEVFLHWYFTKDGYGLHTMSCFR